MDIAAEKCMNTRCRCVSPPPHELTTPTSEYPDLSEISRQHAHCTNRTSADLPSAQCSSRLHHIRSTATAKHQPARAAGNAARQTPHERSNTTPRVPTTRRKSNSSTTHPRTNRPSRPRVVYGLRTSDRRKSIPPACWPTSTLATFLSATKSITSTVPGSEPIPSTEMNA